MTWTGPVLDNHLHLDFDGGVGPSVVRDFVNAGGTHLLVLNKPSWWYGVEARQPEDFDVGYDATIETVARATDLLPGRAWPVLGVHPALISRLVEEGMTVEEAEALMQAGIDRAAERVKGGKAIAVKSGRPHYPVDDRIWEASNRVIRHAFARGAEVECAVQLHTESGTDFSEFATWAEDVGLDPARVVKHYASGPTKGATPSVISHRDHLDSIVAAETAFLMETDYLDDPDRPGAVLGPKTVPRRVEWMAESGHTAAIECAHVSTPLMVYGIDTHDTFVD